MSLVSIGLKSTEKYFANLFNPVFSYYYIIKSLPKHKA